MRRKRERLDPQLHRSDEALCGTAFTEAQRTSLQEFRRMYTDGWESSADHRVRFELERWDSVPGWSPRFLQSTDGYVTRHALFQLADECNKRGDWRPLMMASFIWGTGDVGYGPWRLQQILGSADDLDDTLAQAVERLATNGPLSAYAFLRGQRDEPWATGDGVRRVAGWGPAFFTKFLHFAGQSVAPANALPLILDARVARTLRSLALGVNAQIGVDEEYVGELAHWAWPSGGWWTGRYKAYLAFVTAQLSELKGGAWSRDDPAMLEIALWQGYPRQ